MLIAIGVNKCCLKWKNCWQATRALTVRLGGWGLQTWPMARPGASWDACPARMVKISGARKQCLGQRLPSRESPPEEHTEQFNHVSWREWWNVGLPFSQLEWTFLWPAAQLWSWVYQGELNNPFHWAASDLGIFISFLLDRSDPPGKMHQISCLECRNLAVHVLGLREEG